MMLNLARELHSGWPLRFAFTLFVSFIVYNLKMNSFMPSFKCWRKQGFKTNLFECVSALLTLIADAFIILLLYLLGLVRVRILFLYLLGRLHIDYMEYIMKVYDTLDCSHSKLVIQFSELRNYRVTWSAC
jgi:hypothetical protein